MAATQQQTVEAWLDITLSNLRERVKELRIQDTGALLASIQGHLVSSAGDDVQRLSIAYAVYGQFVDMGVGRGMGAGLRKVNSQYATIRDERGRLFNHARKARPWSSKELGRQTLRLSVLLSDYYGRTTLATLQAALPGEVGISL
jgi:hypothetical protein